MDRWQIRKLGVISVFLIIFGVGIGLFDSPSMSLAQSNKEVKIGLLHPLTGGAAHVGLQYKRIYDYVADEINAQGGIKSLGGAKIKLLPADNQGKIDVGIAETERLAREGASLIIGAYLSSIALVATQQAERLKVPFLVDCGVADEITERGLKYTFRYSTPTKTVMKDGIKLVIELSKANKAPFKTVSIAYENSAFGQSVIKSAKKYFAEYGIEIVADIPYDRKAVDFSSEVRKIKAVNADVACNTGYTGDGLLLMRTMKEQGIRPMALWGLLDGFYTDTKVYRETLGEYALYNYMIRFYGLNHHDARYKALAKGFKARYKEDMDVNAEWGYQTIYIAKEVLELAGSTDREKIREAFTKLVYKDHLSTSEEPIRFGPDGQNTGATSTVLQQHPEGDMVVYPPKYAEKKAVWPHPSWKKK